MAKKKDTEGEPTESRTLRGELDKIQKPENEIWIPTGSTIADIVVGAGRGMGNQAGQVINLVSESQGGKTAICNEIIANGYKKYGEKLKWIYDQTCENGNTFDTEKLYDMNIIPKDPEKQVRSKTVQEGFGEIMSFLDKLKDDEFGIYVFDSIDALSSEELEDQAEERLAKFEKGEEYTKGSYQQEKAKFMSNMFLPQICDLAEKKNCLVILVSQLRDNVGGGLFSEKNRIASGRALLFYCTTRIWLRALASIEAAGREIGTVVDITTKKARGPWPYRHGQYIFYYEYGIDNVGGNVDYLYDLRTPDKGELSKKAAKTLDWDGTEYSRSSLIAYIEENNLEGELEQRVITKWKAIEEKAGEEIAGRKKRF